MTNPDILKPSGKKQSLSDWFFIQRLSLGRHLVHLGLHLMPQCRARAELYQLFELWGTQAHAAVRAYLKEMEDE